MDKYPSPPSRANQASSSTVYKDGNVAPDKSSLLSLLTTIGKLGDDYHMQTPKHSDNGGKTTTMHAYTSISPRFLLENHDESQSWNGVQTIVPVGPIQISLVGRIQFASSKVDLLVSVIVPLLPAVNVGRFQEQIVKNYDSSSVPVTVPGTVGSGSALVLHVKETAEDRNTEAEFGFDGLYLKGKLTVYQETYQVDVRLLFFPKHQTVNVVKETVEETLSIFVKPSDFPNGGSESASKGKHTEIY